MNLYFAAMSRLDQFSGVISKEDQRMIHRDIEHIQDGTCFREGMRNGCISGYLRQIIPHWLDFGTAIKSMG